MENKKILELALEALEKQKAEIDAAIAEIRELQDGNKRVIARKPEMPSLVVTKRKSKTLAERKAHSLRMKKYWAAKRAQAAGKSSAAKTTPAAGAKLRSKTEAQKKAISLAMKKAWEKRKAAAKKKV